jgi:DNA polymerase-3 subunit gamma/tau
LLRMLAFKPPGTPSSPKTSPLTGSSTTETNEKGTLVKKLQPASTTPVEVSLQNLSPDNWHLLFQQLDLSGVIHNIANHCNLDSIQENQGAYHLQLTLDETQAALFNTSHQERLASFLSQKFSCSVTVKITPAAVLRETPAAVQQRLQREQQEAAEKLFLNDPQIQALIGHFEGKVISDSIHPVHH